MKTCSYFYEVDLEWPWHLWKGTPKYRPLVIFQTICPSIIHVVETYCFSAVYCCYFYYYYYYYYSKIWRRERSPAANIHPIFAKLPLNSLHWIILLKLVNSANLHIQDGSHGLIWIFKIDVKLNALQSRIFIRSLRFFFWTPSDGLSYLSSKIS